MKKIVLSLLIMGNIVYASTGKQLVIENGCMECHNIMGKKLAPAFMGTAKKNIKMFGKDAKVNIIKGIKNGSKGKYGNFKHTEMPSFEYLKSSELNLISNWILEEYAKNKKLYPNGRQNK